MPIALFYFLRVCLVFITLLKNGVIPISSLDGARRTPQTPPSCVDADVWARREKRYPIVFLLSSFS